MILPVPLAGYGSIRFSGLSGAVDRPLGIDGRAVRMTRHMRRCDGLTGSAGSRARSRIRSDIPRSGMRIKRRLANNRHLENASLNPCLERFERVARALVVWKLLLKVGQDTLGAVNRPDGQGLLIGSLYQREHVVVFVCDRELRFSHSQSPQAHAPLRGRFCDDRQDFVDKQFQRGQVGKAATVEQKRVHAERNERAHLRNDLRRCAHKAKVILVLGAIAIPCSCIHIALII